MEIKKITLSYFSPTGGTEFIGKFFTEKLSCNFGTDFIIDNFTLPESRNNHRMFGPEELLIMALPVYAGRVPNKLLPYLMDSYTGNDALAIPIVVFGNRSYDNALIELRNILEKNRFHTVAAGAFVSYHAFSDIVGKNRPDEHDRNLIAVFANKTYEHIYSMREIPDKIDVKSLEDIDKYYTPLKEDGTPANFLKAKPKTREELCNQCGICSSACPMGSIDENNPKDIHGICIKCQACVRKCPKHAKYFDNGEFCSHVRMLEKNCIGYANAEFFL